MIRTPNPSESAPRLANPQAVRAAAADLFVQAFPLVLLDAVRRAHDQDRDQFRLVRGEAVSLAPGLADDEDGRLILASAWIDLSEEPVVIHLPHAQGRRCVLSLWDATGAIFASFGSCSGEDAWTDVALVGPRWRGQLPGGLRARRAPSNGVWAVSRIYPHSALDRPAALAPHNRHCLGRLHGGRELLHPPIDVLQPPPTSCLRQAEDVSPADLLGRLNELLSRAEPGGHGPLHSSLQGLAAQIGAPAEAPAWPAPVAEAVECGFVDGVAAIRTAAAQSRQRAPGWRVLPPGMSEPGLTPLARAARAFTSLGAPAREDLLTLVCDRDDGGMPLSGAHRYRLHFAGGSLPSVQAFWRLSVGGPSVKDRSHGLGDRSDLVLGPDGSLDIFVQHAPPASRHIPNWLPTPTGEWALVMRMHGPRADSLSPVRNMPSVDRVPTQRGGQQSPWRWRPSFGVQPRIRAVTPPPPEEMNL